MAQHQRSRRVGYVLALSVLAGTVATTTSHAQSSLGRAANGATGQSLRDAVDQAHNDLLDSQILGNSSSASSSAASSGGSAGSGGGAIGAAATPTGRLRHSEHDPYDVPFADRENFAFETDEASVFATGMYTLPGTTLGGKVKVTVLGGYNWLSLDMKNGGGNTLSTHEGQSGSAENESALFGGELLWWQGSTYALASLIGMWGETTLEDAIDFCNPPGGGCPVRVYDFDTSGFISKFTVGHYFALSNAAGGPFLDLRGDVGYAENVGDRFSNFRGDTQKYTFSTWTVTGSATLFSNINLSGGALLRPYLQGYVRQEIDYRNELAFVDTGTPGTVEYDQAHTYGGGTLGLTYTSGNLTLGSAVYYEGSADEETIGGRLGAAWSFD